MVTRGTSQNERNKYIKFWRQFFLITLNAYAFEELTACFVFGDSKRPQTRTRAHRQCVNPEGVQGVRNPLENNRFYRKKQLGPITLEKVGPPDIFDPPPPPPPPAWTLVKIIVSLK